MNGLLGSIQVTIKPHIQNLPITALLFTLIILTGRELRMFFAIKEFQAKLAYGFARVLFIRAKRRAPISGQGVSGAANSMRQHKWLLGEQKVRGNNNRGSTLGFGKLIRATKASH